MYERRHSVFPGLTEGVKGLMILNGLVFLGVLIAPQAGILLALVPARILQTGSVYELLTAMFVHFAPAHLIFNMLALFFFGPQIERDLGTKRFIGAYLIAGLVGNICSFAVGPTSPIPTIGASGAIMGIIAIFAYRYPDAQMLVFFVLPVRAWTFLVFYVALDLMMGLSSIGNSGGGIAYFAHVGGAVAGLVWYKYWYLPRRFKRF